MAATAGVHLSEPACEVSYRQHTVLTELRVCVTQPLILSQNFVRTEQNDRALMYSTYDNG